MKPRLAIEISEKNYDNTWTLYITKYFDIENTNEILSFISNYSNKLTLKVNRFYYANNYGIEIDYAER